ncbi:hypothetical protein L484_023481 [Morus notabilis]|uniref:Uncharacterized protein n=1 Tax=Morus notabilis TaxID=981085 RepID=W9RDG4_9ROSA|nr:hypothetical protein L484_023481 [Morus notabilis]
MYYGLNSSRIGCLMLPQFDGEFYPYKHLLRYKIVDMIKSTAAYDKINDPSLRYPNVFRCKICAATKSASSRIDELCKASPASPSRLYPPETEPCNVSAALEKGNVPCP